MSPIEIRLRIRTLCFRCILYLHSHLTCIFTSLSFPFSHICDCNFTNLGSKGFLTHGKARPSLLKLQNVFSNSSLCKSASKIQLLESVLRFTLCVVGDNTVANVFSLFDSWSFRAITPCVSTKDKRFQVSSLCVVCTESHETSSDLCEGKINSKKLHMRKKTS